MNTPRFLKMYENSQMKMERYYEVMATFRKGGITPQNVDEIILQLKSLPQPHLRSEKDFEIFSKFNLCEVNPEDHIAIMREVIRRGIQLSKKCWHYEAGVKSCNVDRFGRIIINGAHSVQNNRILNEIAEDGHIMEYDKLETKFVGKEIGRYKASVFYGFCNKHDSIFRPIEVEEYKASEEQNFLFAYRAFVVSSHKALEVGAWTKIDPQLKKDIQENKEYFDKALQNQDYGAIKSFVYKMPYFCPIASSSSFYLDYDFEGMPIEHSETKRMEDIFITLFPIKDCTFFILSYFRIDEKIYGMLGDQIQKRSNFESDLTMLIAAHTEDVYFKPSYFEKYISKLTKELEQLMNQTQKDNAVRLPNGKIMVTGSKTPNNYLNNTFGINFFYKD